MPELQQDSSVWVVYAWPWKEMQQLSINIQQIAEEEGYWGQRHLFGFGKVVDFLCHCSCGLVLSYKHSRSYKHSAHQEDFFLSSDASKLHSFSTRLRPEIMKPLFVRLWERGFQIDDMIRNNNNYYFSKHMNTLLWYAWISKLLNSGTSICLTSMPCACPGARQDILILCQSCKPKFSLKAIDL